MPSTVHFITDGGFDSSLEQCRVSSDPIWPLSGPLICTRSPETKMNMHFIPATSLEIVLNFSESPKFDQNALQNVY